MFSDIVGEIGENRGTILKVGGWGEPSVHEDFGDMMSHCLDGQVRTYVFTNGMILSRMAHGDILELEQTTIVISVDGYDAEQYESIRIGGDYRELRENITVLFNRRKASMRRFPKIVVQHVVFPGDTSHQLEGFRRSWAGVTDMVDFCVYNPLVPAGTPVHQAFPRTCKRVRRELSVLYDGSVPVCGPQSKHGGYTEVGSVTTESIGEIWNGSKLTQLRHAHTVRELDSVPFCKSCIYFR
jgi:MoaA/NifB/PqqE/SkfB family radical SAM enzyme